MKQILCRLINICVRLGSYNSAVRPAKSWVGLYSKNAKHMYGPQSLSKSAHGTLNGTQSSSNISASSSSMYVCLTDLTEEPSDGQ
jgi:hypothetical protein